MYFRINGDASLEFNNHIIAGTYAVNESGSYMEWMDASNTKHRRIINNKINGTFDMFFRTVADFEAFQNAINSNVNQNNAVNTYLTVNNLVPVSERFAELYITFELVRDRDGAWNDYFKRFKVKVEER